MKIIKQSLHFFGDFVCTEGRNRTGTNINVRGILSPLCLPISPPRRIIEASTRFELVSGGFADRCLNTWLRRQKKASI